MAQYDAALHLLDRQVVGSDGRLVAKVDDVELTVDPDGALVPTALLVGLPALLPRFGGRLGRWLLRRYVDLGTMQADRAEPSVIELDLVESVTSEVRLSVPGSDVIRRRVDQGVPSVVERWRLGELVGLPVRCGQLPARSRVLDVRLTAAPDRPGRSRVGALVVGPARPGALLGYDRKREPGPRAVAEVVRWLHRHARVVELGTDVEVDRDAGEVRIGSGASLLPLPG